MGLDEFNIKYELAEIEIKLKNILRSSIEYVPIMQYKEKLENRLFEIQAPRLIMEAVYGDNDET